MKIGYLRVSSDEQCLDRQIDALEATCDRLFVERYSGKSLNRPVFQEVLSMLAAGDTLVVMSIDRAFRSTSDAITQAEQLQARGVLFVILNLAVDTGTADGMLAYTIVAAVAQHERARISERTRQGLAAARKRGKRLGRPPKLTDNQLAEARRRIGNKENVAKVAGEMGVAAWTLSRALKRPPRIAGASSLNA